MKSKFLNVSLGIAAILLSAGFLIRSVNVANASPAPERFIEEGAGKIGKYMIDFCITTAQSGVVVKNAIVWNTETGKSTHYYVNATTGKWEKNDNQLPDNPVDE